MSVTFTAENGGVQFFSRNMAVRGLATEIVTGMKMSRISALEGCRNHGLIPEGRTTKKKALRIAVENMKYYYPEWTPGERIEKALLIK